ncbi:histidine phosphatase family protein [Aliifodinibius sp. S!AR15-10]|uniref:histidine phosphatase family protein n=1 Tax=Aliifodinibius sp. S!AR15-10 TaxID=2950437 RepID=UPI0028541EC7|nr:histidine phosphatase family protein [Aliifodinibius sp. S!AR15-10]MDR8391759.1 histidine phosphatase family protein [Aliifodinibius sp. S!AR15-10]
MPITNLFIIRHGETEYNRIGRMQGRGIDQPLNETGRLQARATAKYLKDFGIDIAVSSSLKRSKETAGIVADDYKVNLLSYKELDEIDFGIYEGQYSKDIQDELDTIHERWQKGEVHLAIEGGESPSQALDRVSRRMVSVIEEHEGKNILVVLHGRLIRILLSYWLGYGLERMHEIKHSNGALYHLKWNGKAFEIVCLNKTDHLQESLPKKVDS